jgi:hypothetical protein
MGRIDAVHVRSTGVTVQLFHGAAGHPAEVPIDLFPSVAWAEQSIGRWVFLNGQPGGAKVVLGPNELISHAVDEKTNELVLSCVLCKVEMGRLPESITKEGPGPMIEAVKLMLGDHLTKAHPEILEAIK